MDSQLSASSITEATIGRSESPSQVLTTASTTFGKSIDFSGFLTKEFNVKSWINEALSVATSSSSNSIVKSRESELLELEKHTSTLVEKLQFLNQEVSNRLERTVEDITKSMPRIITDLQVMQNDATKLKSGVSLVKSQLNNVEEDTGKALDRLKYLDLVKTRMEASRNVLKEAENWSNLEQEASNIFASQDYQKASVRLMEAEKSLVIFQNTPEYEERRKLLTELQNQLEATVSPQLVNALNQHDIGVCQKFYQIFSQIGRNKDFCNYYYGSRKAPLVKMWQYALLTDIPPSVSGNAENPVGTGGSDPFNNETSSTSPKSPTTPKLLQQKFQLQVPKKFVEFLQEFYDELFIILNQEHTWCGNVFPDTNETLMSLIENIFNSLKPPLSARLAGLVEFYNEDCLPEIIDTWIVSENFGRHMEKVLFNPIQISSGMSSSANGSVGGKRNNVSSLTDASISGKSLSRANLITWGNVVFEPFSEYQHDYSEYEKNYLIMLLNNTITEKRKVESLDLAKVMSETIGEIFMMAESGLNRCMTLTYGFGGIGLIEVLNFFFTTFIKEYQILLDQLRLDSGLDGSFCGRGVLSGTSAVNKGGDNSNNDYFDFDQDKLQQEDWSNFHIGLKLLATCRTTSERLSEFEEKVKNNLATVKDLIVHDSLNEDLEWYERRSSVTSSLEGQIKRSTFTGTQSSLLLLRQSPLNSYHLNELLTNIETKQILSPSVNAVDIFIRSCQRYIFDTIFFPIARHLTNLPNMEIWNSVVEKVQNSPFNLQIPTFSLQPSEYITRIGEHLLTLPQQFEVYADDKSLEFSIKSLPYSDEKPIQEKEIYDLIEDKKKGSTVKEKGNPEEIETTSITIVGESSTIKEEGSMLQSEDEEISTEEITHAWITSLARGTMHAICEKVLMIPQLSTHGTQQLLTDLGYLTNVLSTLDIPPIRELHKIVKVLEMDEDQIFRMLRYKGTSLVLKE
ncbi:3587_t:CDS:2 [Funneliformis caledonium]|uniref:Conserved oligomeric Golgi complex subunit 7 n=1 Tax=Funneliformis caledonium TaxID=1117310 RepID=A0A9N9BHY6_9GLOM|nr:3587_t:CDS:2 [Funneliformis caledonium]